MLDMTPSIASSVNLDESARIKEATTLEPRDPCSAGEQLSPPNHYTKS